MCLRSSCGGCCGDDTVGDRVAVWQHGMATTGAITHIITGRRHLRRRRRSRLIACITTGASCLNYCILPVFPGISLNGDRWVGCRVVAIKTLLSDKYSESRHLRHGHWLPRTHGDTVTSAQAAICLFISIITIYCLPNVGPTIILCWAIVGSQRWAIVILLVGATLALPWFTNNQPIYCSPTYFQPL